MSICRDCMAILHNLSNVVWQSGLKQAKVSKVSNQQIRDHTSQAFVCIRYCIDKRKHVLTKS